MGVADIYLLVCFCISVNQKAMDATGIYLLTLSFFLNQATTNYHIIQCQYNSWQVYHANKHKGKGK